MKPLHVVLAAGLVVAAGLVFFGDKTADMDVAEPMVRTRASAVPERAAAAGPNRVFPGERSPLAAAEPVILALVRRTGLEATMPGESADDTTLFRSHDWTPPKAPAAAVAVTAPSAPVLPYTYIGKAASSGQWQVFLASGEQTLVVQVNETIDGKYRVDAIVPPLLTITYLPLKQIQQLNIGVID